MGEGLTESTTNLNLYYSIIGVKYTILLPYVDDLIIAGDNIIEMDRVEGRLEDEFEMSKLGKPSIYLGAELVYDKNGIWIHQRRYIQDIS